MQIRTRRRFFTAAPRGYMRVSILAAIVMTIAACQATGTQGGGEAVALELSRVPTAPGEEVTLELINGSSTAVGYNLCTSTLVRQVDGTWSPVPSDRVCTMELRSLQPGENDRFTLALPVDLGPGTYRFTTRIEVEGGDMEEVASPSFELR